MLGCTKDGARQVTSTFFGWIGRMGRMANWTDVFFQIVRYLPIETTSQGREFAQQCRSDRMTRRPLHTTAIVELFCVNSLRV